MANKKKENNKKHDSCHWKGLTGVILFVFIITIITACSSLDCPLNNTVYTKYMLKGENAPLADTLTITTLRSIDGSDSVLINQQVNTDSFELPMSYAQDKDIIYIERRDTNAISSIYKQTSKDTVVITKTNEPHFESVDCNASYFHTITDVTYTRNGIDSIKINNSKVNYDTTKPHFLIYFKLND